MFIQLAATHYLWRAHIVRGVLESHGIPAGVCGEESSLLYGPVATLGLRVVIHEDDFDDAVEVLTARPESLPEESVDAPADAPVRVTPDFFSLFAAMLVVWAARTGALVAAISLAPSEKEGIRPPWWAVLGYEDAAAFLKDLPLMVLAIAVVSGLCSLALRPLDTRRSEDFLWITGMLLFVVEVSEIGFSIFWIIQSF